MRCYTVAGTGLDSLRHVERAEPAQPTAGDVLVEVHAVSLNYRDLLVADGNYGGPQDPPIIPCSDMSGVVAAIGPKATSLKPGDRVLNAPFRHWPAGILRREWSRTFVGGQGVDGVLAERMVYPADALVKLPEYLTFEQGATLTVAGLTAWAAIVTHGQTRPGDWVLLHGTGGVSIFTAQLARLLGARVILSTAHEDKANRVRTEFGVEATIDYRDEDWPQQVRGITGGRGVDVVVETAGGPTLVKSIEACGYGARVGVIGVLAGLTSPINVFHLIMHQVTLRGIYMESTAELHALVRAMEAGRLVPCVDRAFDFADARAAYQYLRSQQHFGKVVIRLR